MAADRPGRQVLSRVDTGALVRDARRYAGITQAELARRLGTKQSVISRWERGADIPRVDTLGRILQACGFEADLTFRRHDDEDRTQLALNLAMTPAQRLRTVEHVSRFAASARRHDRASA
ncbi:MAG TPA: helix-turn-helix transcriptional regulator [Acidimicrobiia bacterium]|nr:helix-turn-helix transcriptional regulator [Acidimicrobiia bacterium]